MRELRDSIEIAVPHQRVWEWLAGLVDHYTEWHPAHLEARWERGSPNEIGSVMRVVENLGGHREELRFELTDVDPGRRIDYRLLGPIGVLVPRGAFEVIPTNGGSTFVATISSRFGWLTGCLFAHRTRALRAHMQEEGENLKRILEAVGEMPPARS